MITRRRILGHAGGVSLAGLVGALSSSQQVRAADYKAVLVIYLNGGYDGNNVLVPMGSAYSSYMAARTPLALAQNNLLSLGSFMGQQLGLPPSLSPLKPLFDQKRLAFIANAGPLLQPTTVASVLNNTAKLPPFLYSHPEQAQTVQGWTGDADPSGWGGRAMELLDPSLTGRQPLVAVNNEATLVTSGRLPLSRARSGQNANWGPANLANKSQTNTRRIDWMGRLQSTNAYEQEYVRSLRSAFDSTVDFARGQTDGPAPAGVFADTNIGRDLRFLARHIPYAKATGAQRQVYSVSWGNFDTHANQNSMDAGDPGLEFQLRQLADAMAAFDTSMKAVNMDREVTVLVVSEFGRTLDPAAGLGSDHAWGNHWMVMGGAVLGGKVYGDKFPQLMLGGPDDCSNSRRGVWVPQYATDQVAADLLLWLGLTPQQALVALPNLGKFTARKVGYL